MKADKQQYGDVLQAYKWLREGKVVRREGETRMYRLRKPFDIFVLEIKWDSKNPWEKWALNMLHDWEWLSDRWMVVEEGTT